MISGGERSWLSKEQEAEKWKTDNHILMALKKVIHIKSHKKNGQDKKCAGENSYVEGFTECDKCEYLNECLKRGYLINTTSLGDNFQHYVREMGSHCIRHDEALRRFREGTPNDASGDL